MTANGERPPAQPGLAGDFRVAERPIVHGYWRDLVEPSGRVTGWRPLRAGRPVGKVTAGFDRPTVAGVELSRALAEKQVAADPFVVPHRGAPSPGFGISLWTICRTDDTNQP